ncbi:unnamed protein product [Polarella glacialis]|nr:unnamed protein product [Polarella glacialis]
MLACPEDVANKLARLVTKNPISKMEFKRMADGIREGTHELACADSSLTAARFWLVNSLCFNANMSRLSFSGVLAASLARNRETRLKRRPGLGDQTAGRLHVQVQDAFEAIESSPAESFLFLDPPYLHEKKTEAAKVKVEFCGQCCRCSKAYKCETRFQKHVKGCQATSLDLPKGCNEVACLRCGKCFTQQAGFTKHTASCLSSSVNLVSGEGPAKLRKRTFFCKQPQYACGPNWGMDEHRKLHDTLVTRSRWILCHDVVVEVVVVIIVVVDVDVEVDVG